jgi:tetratricopeptide (TPR) repeat protein
MMIRLSLLLAVLLAPPSCEALLPALVRRPSTTTTSSRLMAGMEDYESNREAFEGLHLSLPKVVNSDNTTLKKSLTASAKRLKEMELTLLQHLKDSDDAIDPLVDLWMLEREDAAQELRAMEMKCSPGLEREIGQLHHMMDYYGNEWVEPMSRLALVYFTKGNYLEATELCQSVLQAKPWHFEAAQLLVALFLRQDQYGNAIKAARQLALPALNVNTNHKRRREWVTEATAKAMENLRQAEVATFVAVQDEHFEECPVGEANHCFE